ncbi:hypothetical protein NL676_027610 [Syzygium grande]|nr:hypothetical protein NL676_027610 [Syzygium grande]
MASATISTRAAPDASDSFFLFGVQVVSPWFVPFACLFLARNAYRLVEAVSCGAKPKAWWNSQRMLLIRRTTPFFFTFIDAILNRLGLSQIAFNFTAKVVTDDAVSRYEKEIMDFSGSSMMFVSVATLALLNLFCLAGWIDEIWHGLEVVGANGSRWACGLVQFTRLPCAFHQERQRALSSLGCVQVCSCGFSGLSNCKFDRLINKEFEIDI